MRKNDCGPAFPRPDSTCSEADAVNGTTDPGSPGMTLRDWFASQAPPMPDDWASFRRVELPEHEEPQQELRLMAEWAYSYADAMIAARG
jgi:hypothetical protein